MCTFRPKYDNLNSNPEVILHVSSSLGSTR